MYDPVETDASFLYLERLVKDLGDGFVIIGGWAVHLLVRDSFRRATGREYLRSRDIDVVISAESKYVDRFKKGIQKMGFAPGGLPFRYQLVLDRETGKVLDEKAARKKDTFDLLHIDLDVFSVKKVDLATWVMNDLGPIIKNKVIIGSIPVARAAQVLKMKMMSIGSRENTDKREKDACDIYALLFHSDLGLPAEIAKEEIVRIADDYSAIISETLFEDPGQAGLIRRKLEDLAEK